VVAGALALTPHAPHAAVPPAARRTPPRQRWRRLLALATLVAASGLLAPAAQADALTASLRYCDKPAKLSAGQQDLLLRFAAVVKNTLDDSGQRLALVARSGLDLARFGQRYSHAGVALLDSANTPWSVRQLYFDCDAQRPRLFDQGLAGFVLGTDDPGVGYLSVLLLPPDAAAALVPLALDNPASLQWLSASYSANAHAFSTVYQNCNQWLVELLAAAWAPLTAAGAGSNNTDTPNLPNQPALPGQPGPSGRSDAQRWLQAQGYEPTRFEVGWRPLMWLGTALVPYLHDDDHPQADLAQAVYRVSMPASIEAWVQRRWPGAQRLEFCHVGQQVVVHHGWAPVAEGCQAGPGDSVITLD